MTRGERGEVTSSLRKDIDVLSAVASIPNKFGIATHYGCYGSVGKGFLTAQGRIQDTALSPPNNRDFPVPEYAALERAAYYEEK